MKYIVIMFFFFNVTSIFAKGVSAGTIIQNRATLNFSIDGNIFNIESNIEKSVVAQLVDVKVSWIDTQPVTVTSGEKNRVLTYKVLNSGNAKDRFALSAKKLNYKSGFNIDRKRIYVDSNDNYRFDLFDRPRKSIKLDEDEEQLIFVVSKISNSFDLSSGTESFINLKARSYTGGSGQKGKIYPGKGVKGVDVVDGLTGGIGEDEGIYKLLTANVILNKDVSIDEDGLITVTIEVSVVGEGSVKDVRVLDEIPNETRYIKGSMMLDGGFLTDQRDSDVGRFKRRYRRHRAKILIDLGELDSSSFHTISYNLKIR